MVALLRGLAAPMPRGLVRWTEPAGGCTLWLTIDGRPQADEPELLARCREAGVLVAPGSLFFPAVATRRGRGTGRSGRTRARQDGEPGLHARLSIARVKTHQVDDACRRLARAVAALSSGVRSETASS
jgi:DNA-binding transcriptional MocR family regulator